MRRLSPEERSWLICRLKKLDRYEKRRTKRDRRRKLPDRYALVLAAPHSFDIDEVKARPKLLQFLQQLRQALVRDKRSNICIDFEPTDRLSAGGTLLFVAELHRALRLTKSGPKVRCIPPKKRKVGQVFHQIGLYSLLKVRGKHSSGIDRDVIHWRFATGRGADGSKYDDILSAYDGTITPALTSKLYVSLTEAMNNAHHHAHVGTRLDGLNITDDVKDWWMFSQERDGFLHVVFCDLGVGIPVTLPKKHPGSWQRLKQLVTGPPSDADIIQAATRLQVSRTGQEHRGRGLSQMVNAITGSFHGSVSIYSNHGQFLFDGQRERLRNYSTSIIGTLIAWRIPLPDKSSRSHAVRNH